MSRMLNLCDHLLNQGKKLKDLGRSQDALTVLNRLSSFRELPPEIAEQTQFCLAEIQLDRRKPSRARRHLIAALGYQPNHPRYHYLIAKSLCRQVDDPELENRCAKHFRLSLEEDPSQHDVRAEYGFFHLRRGLVDDGLAQLRRAWENSDDPKYLATLVKGLRWAGRWKEARDAIRAALFRHPRNGDVRKLWNDFRFLRWVRKQRRRQQRNPLPKSSEPIFLKFPIQKGTSSTEESDGKVLRHESASALKGPRHLKSRPDQRHVR